MVFVNAWNEWAEGAVLEPRRDLGRGFLRLCTAPIGVELFLMAAARTRISSSSKWLQQIDCR